MKIGNRYKVRPAFTRGNYGEDSTCMLTGRCVYIHPRGRYGILEFPGGARECFWPEELKDKEAGR